MENSNENAKFIERLNKIILNKDFLNKLLTLEKIEDVKKLFSDNGIEITNEELKLMGEYLREYIRCESKDSKLTEKELEYISGGVNTMMRYLSKWISFPFALFGYAGGTILGSIPTAFAKGVYDGAINTWYNYDD